VTKDEKRWLDCITQLGCCVCLFHHFVFTPAEPHHMLYGDRRRGHLYTIPLCPPHHRSGKNDEQATSRDQSRRRFEARYGTEEQLLLKTRDAVEARFGFRPALPEARAARLDGVDIDAIHHKLWAVKGAANG
jgi:hypothetical protein